MTTIEATYRIVTPMFCAGADQTRAKLRLPSLKGALRFWWRSLAWNRGYRDPEALREAEAFLFGSSQTGRSRILLRSVDRQQRVPVGKQRRFPTNSWESYAGYGITDSKTRREREFIEPGATWAVQLLHSDLRPEHIEQLRSALIALGLLGGLGARSRKGWGSLTLIRMVSKSTDERSGRDWRVPRTRDQLRAALQNLFPVGGRLTELPRWTAVTPRASFAIGPLQKSALAAHRYLVERYRDSVRSITGERKQEREAFGLPRDNLKKNARARRASPIFLHVHEVEGGAAFPIAALLPAVFLPVRGEPTGGWRHLENFLSSVAG